MRKNKEVNHVSKVYRKSQRSNRETLYVKLPSGYVAGKVVEYIYPKYGIVGTYKVKRADGKTMSALTLYCPQVYIDCFKTMAYHDFEKFPCEDCPFNKKCGSYR